MAYQIQWRRDTAAHWTATDPTLAEGEAGLETDTGKVKIGDGATVWSSLDYFTGDLTAHLAAADPHTGYRLESADHNHQSTGAQAGKLDHGASLTGLTDDDHTQYELESSDAADAVTAMGAKADNNPLNHDRYTHPNHSGEVTSVADGAQTIANNAVTLAKLATQATDTFLANVTAGAAVPTAAAVAEQRVVGRITGGHIAALTVAQLQALLFSAAIAEDTLILLDAAISADGHYSGIAEAGTLGETVAFGEVVYLKAVDSQWYLAKADVTATSGAVKLGICLVAGNDNDATTILLWGKVNAAAKFPSFTISAPVFTSAATAGLLTSTAPTGTTNFVVRIVGYANTADELFFCPDNTYLELV